ncbi:MAG: glutamate--tRNA ligase, partial [Psychroserpens sp.]
PSSFDEKASKKAIKEDTVALMTELKAIITAIDDFTVVALQKDIKDWITSKDIGFSKIMMPLRLALVGALQGPDVFDIIYMIGKSETVKRIDALVKTI